MSIFDETKQHETITEGWRALVLFTNRVNAQRLFLSRLNSDTPRKEIVFFYGDGGNGKSLLLRYLAENCCKRFTKENWEHIEAKPDREFAEEIKSAEGAEVVPYAILDFGEQPRGDDNPQQSFSALLMMQRQLARHGFRFPLFTFACVWYLHKTNKLASTNLQGLFPTEEMDLVSTLADSFANTTWGAITKTAIGLFSKHLKERFEIYKTRRGLDDEKVSEIQRMDPDKELMDILPRLFAEDLNAAMKDADKQVVLFFDTHESFVGIETRISDHARFERDRWLRRLFVHLHLEYGIVVVVAGRDKPLWSKATEFKIPEQFLDVHLVGHLTKEDATEYLEKADITDETLQQALVEYAQAEPNEVHPYLLGLCADVVLAARLKGEIIDLDEFSKTEEVSEKTKRMTDRLIRYVDDETGYAVKALCACRAFDKEIFFVVGNALRFNPTPVSFERLITQFSFVWGAEKETEGWYRIHDLMRRLMRERGEETTRKAHEVLETHHRGKHKENNDDAALAEAIYHANQLDWERGVDEWKKVFDETLKKSKYDFCELLLGVRGAMLIEDDFQFALVSQSEGNFFQTLARYESAQREYKESIAAYNRVLQDNPDYVSAHNNKGVVLQSLGDLQSSQSKYDEAVKSYEDSIKAFDTALKLAPDYVEIHNNKGIVLQSLGDLQLNQSKYDEAEQSYKAAIDSCDRSLKIAPKFVNAHLAKGLALEGLGNLKADLLQKDEAIKNLEAAIEEFSAALVVAPDHPNLLSLVEETQAVLDNLRNG